MASNFPTSLDNLAANKTNTSPAVDDHAAHHNDLADAVNAVQSELGVNLCNVAQINDSRVVSSNTHTSSNGSDHSFINQDVTTTGTPTFAKVSSTGQMHSAQASAVVPAGTTATIDFDNGNAQVLDLGSATGDVTLTLSNPIGGSSYLILIIQGATARNVVLPATVLMAGGSAPNTLTITATDNAIDVLTLYYDGTNYVAQHAKAFG